MYTKKHMNAKTTRWETMVLSDQEVTELKEKSEAWVDAIARKFTVKATRIMKDFVMVEGNGEDGYQVPADSVATLASAMMSSYIKTVYSESQQLLDAKIYALEKENKIKGDRK